MEPTIGQIADAAEVKARWAYAEMRSSRFRHLFATGDYEDLLQKAAAGIAFCQLDAVERRRLQAALQVAKTGPYIESVDGSADAYECKAWSEDDLMNAWALSLFNLPEKSQCIPFRDFYRVEPNTDAWLLLDDGDPRVAVRAVPTAVPYQQSEPVIIIGRAGEYLLLEGYLRSLLFMKSPDPSKRLLAWVPVPR
jgi:hypothetical protein